METFGEVRRRAFELQKGRYLMGPMGYHQAYIWKDQQIRLLIGDSTVQIAMNPNSQRV